MEDSAAKWHLGANVQMYHDHAKKLVEKTLSCIDENAGSLSLSPPTTTKGSYRTEPQTHEVTQLKVIVYAKNTIKDKNSSHSAQFC